MEHVNDEMARLTNDDVSVNDVMINNISKMEFHLTQSRKRFLGFANEMKDN
ncbi:MAG: hypothetical protein HQL32_17345 [Planctomycetes bacterium]|nr:hypothetical protein [Planctomycetota bacterium]